MTWYRGIIQSELIVLAFFSTFLYSITSFICFAGLAKKSSERRAKDSNQNLKAPILKSMKRFWNKGNETKCKNTQMNSNFSELSSYITVFLSDSLNTKKTLRGYWYSTTSNRIFSNLRKSLQCMSITKLFWSSFNGQEYQWRLNGSEWKIIQMRWIFNILIHFFSFD